MPLASPPVACLQVRRLLPPRSPRKRLDAGLGRSGRPGRRWRPGPTTPSGLQHDLDAVVLLLLEDLVCRLLLEKKKKAKRTPPSYAQNTTPLHPTHKAMLQAATS